jgi:RNA polymerase sigma-70 factor (ECF subfamily)
VVVAERPSPKFVSSVGAEPRDEELLKSFLAGHPASFDELMRRHEQRIFALALRVTGNRSDALDATQDAFIVAFRRAETFRGEAAFSTWLYRIGINACNDLLRKKYKQELVDPDTIDTQIERSGSVDDPPVRVDIVNALKQLPEEYRTAVVMHDLGGIPYDEIAKLTSAQIGTVKSRISRGRRKLAALLEPGSVEGTSKDHI